MSEINKRAEQLFHLKGAHQVSNAQQASELMETFRREAEAEIMQKRGAEAQVESKKILVDQIQELALMKEIINSLLKYTVEQSQKQAIELDARNKVEEERYLENMRLARLATWTGVVSMIVAVIAIILQVLAHFKFL